jgi:hypothetical protein
MQAARRKVLVRLKGGMGNQLFQYGFALHLANGETGDVLCLLDYFQRDARHGGFALRDLLGPEVLTTDALPAGQNWAYLNADPMADADFSALRNSSCDMFVDGYFQHVANFGSVAGKLKSMFLGQFDQESYAARLRALFGEATDRQLVAIHLRRGDFLDPQVRLAHGIPEPQSMLGCLARINAREYAAAVFSDSSIEIRLPCPSICLSGNEPRSLAGDVDQLRLMSCCDWIIASNSTFGYWAGVLSNRVEQMFIPDPWMRSGSVRTQSLLAPQIEAYGTQLL